MSTLEGKPVSHKSEKLSEMFVGRRILHASYSAEGSVVYELDNGEKLELLPNEGCGGCENGYFALTAYENFPHVITRVEIDDDQQDTEYEGKATVRLFVYGEGLSTTLATVAGSEGNGYYGRGFSVRTLLEF